MRELIRPALFLVARVGLFLSLLAWSLGHMWQGVGVVYGFAGVLDQTGIGVGLDRKSTRTAIIPRAGETMTTQQFLDGVHSRPGDWGLRLHVIAFNVRASEAAIAMQHWLIVTIFALFYGVLKWVYRKRGTEVADGE